MTIMHIAGTIFILLVLGHLMLWKARDTTSFFKNTPIIFGHRGALHNAPENTLEAYQSAIKKGLSALEIDIVSTCDGEIVCSHNFDLERESDGYGFIDEIKYKDLSVVNFGINKFSGQVAKIVRLEKVLKIIPENVLLNIEIKTISFFDLKPLFRLNRLIKKNAQNRKIMVSSFNPLVVLLVKYMNRRIITAMIFETLNHFYLVNFVHPDCINMEAGLLNQKFINWAKKRHLRIGAWTVNTKSAIQWIKKLGVDAIYTDRPEYTL
ncbi:glycerophosphodiester phosphodiesterase [Candidatus Neomarinimicrobiota bacterium]